MKKVTMRDLNYRNMFQGSNEKSGWWNNTERDKKAFLVTKKIKKKK